MSPDYIYIYRLLLLKSILEIQESRQSIECQKPITKQSEVHFK